MGRPAGFADSAIPASENSLRCAPRVRPMYGLASPAAMKHRLGHPKIVLPQPRPASTKSRNPQNQ